MQCGQAPPRAESPPPATSPASVARPTPPTTSTSLPAAAIRPVSVAELGPSWRPGCPVAPEQLHRVEVNHLGFDAQIHRGSLIVHEELAAEVVAIFEQLLQLRYPVEKMRTVDNYPGAEDELSMQDNNTSAFNCRAIPGSSRWSEHAFGRAIDINPLLNPAIHQSGLLEPQNAASYLDRSRIDPGLLHAGDPAVRVFTDRGWQWGGEWRDPVDYQHFER
ncbi:MAG: M15 family metallopeptidase [Mycobacteriaceae bacterium]|nr:M15 family metallopeptidase [Mycobacteriaceae bacterium]